MPQVAAMCTPHTAARGCNIQCRCSDAPILEYSNAQMSMLGLKLHLLRARAAAQGLGCRKTKVDLSLDLRAGHLRNPLRPGLLAVSARLGRRNEAVRPRDRRGPIIVVGTRARDDTSG